MLNAIRTVPRHLFVDEALATRAYEDTALPIGHGQTISQPWVVARMTEALFAEGAQPKKVLEIGTGSGYQAAILAALGLEVYTVERIGELLRNARKRFRTLGLNVRSKHDDGRIGWPENAPVRRDHRHRRGAGAGRCAVAAARARRHAGRAGGRQRRAVAAVPAQGCRWRDHADQSGAGGVRAVAVRPDRLTWQAHEAVRAAVRARAWRGRNIRARRRCWPG